MKLIQGRADDVKKKGVTLFHIKQDTFLVKKKIANPVNRTSGVVRRRAKMKVEIPIIIPISLRPENFSVKEAIEQINDCSSWFWLSIGEKLCIIMLTLEKFSSLF